jgi:hypothetical protein
MNFIDDGKFEKYLFYWNKKEQKGGKNEPHEEEPFLGRGGFPLNEFNIIKQNDEKHISRFKDLVVPMGLVLERNH